MRETTSICSICYKDTQAFVYQTKGKVYMGKTCCKTTISMVENDADFYNLVKTQSVNEIYPGLFIDITNTCNMECKYCYHPKQGNHIEKEQIINVALNNINLAPFFLSGGEPTLHPQLFDIIDELKPFGIGIVSNGLLLTDKDFCSSLVKHLDYGTGVVPIGLSYHDNLLTLKLALDNISNENVKTSSVLFVVDKLNELEYIKKMILLLSPQVDHFRVKAGTKLWAEKKDSGIFNSDLFSQFPGAVINETKNNSRSLVNIIWKGISIMLVCWYNINNIDLTDIDCPPYYTDKFGNIANLVTSCVRNEADNVCS